MDESALQYDTVTVSSGARGAQLLLNRAELVDFIQARLLPLTVQ